MSGIINKVGKVFKKVWDFVKPIVKIVAIAVAVYFTAGVALSYFGPTAAFAAGMPGFTGAAGAGTGFFSTAAANIGLGQGLAQGAIAAGTSSGALAGAGFSASQIAAGQVAAQTAAAASSAAASGVTTFAVPEAGAAVGGNAAGGVAAKAGMSVADKLLLAGTATSAVSGLTAKTGKENFKGSFYGSDKKGAGGGTAPSPATPEMPKESAPVTAAKPQALQQQTQQQQAAVPPKAAGGSLIPDISYSGQPQAGAKPDFAVTGSVPLSTPKLIPDVAS